jgi:LPXTG-motif cell wall-anchored protein
MKVSTKYFGTLPMTGKDFGLTYYAIYILIIGMLIFLARKKLSN